MGTLPNPVAQGDIPMRYNTKKNRMEICGSYAKIFLKGDTKKFAMVDLEDLELVRGYSWHLGSFGYPKASIKSQKKTTSILMHSLILPAPPGFVVDHANRDPLDNRQNTGNLRIVTQQENTLNRKGFSKLSKYKGSYRLVFGNNVYYSSRIAGQYLGTFRTPLQAALAYDLAAMLCFPGVCVTNFKY